MLHKALQSFGHAQGTGTGGSKPAWQMKTLPVSIFYCGENRYVIVDLVHNPVLPKSKWCPSKNWGIGKLRLVGWPYSWQVTARYAMIKGLSPVSDTFDSSEEYNQGTKQTWRR